MGRFPNNKRFAFTIFDDTDFCTVENVLPVYRFLTEIGFKTTKSVWPLGPVADAPINGVSLQNRRYLRFILWLQSEGFEIGLHNVQDNDAVREITERGLGEFKTLVGHNPRTHSNHAGNRDCIYWGDSRLKGPTLRLGYNLATRYSRYNYFKGHVQDSSHFWGDLCRERIDYVRNFVFDEINLDRINPTLPYHDPGKSFVNFWFSSSEGGDVDSFCKILGEANQDRLEAEEGICIIYTHFAKGFSKDGLLHEDFARLMRRLAKMNGWFVPVSMLLDHLRFSRRGNHDIPPRELGAMERRWFLTKLQNGTS